MSIDPVLFSLKVYGVVIIVSFLCAIIIWGIVRVLSAMEKPAVKKTVISSSQTAAQPVAAGIPAAHIAAISAAAYAMFGAVAIVRIENSGRGTAWVSSGRLTHQTSHSPSIHR